MWASMLMSSGMADAVVFTARALGASFGGLCVKRLQRLTSPAGVAVLHTEDDHLHLRTGAVLDYPLPQVRAYLARACQPQFKFLCVNDLPQVEAAIPDTRAWIERAIAA